MASHEFFKFKTRDRSALTGGLLFHVSGSDRPEEYVTNRDGVEAVVDLLGDSQKRTAKAVAYVEATKRHHKAAPCVELLITGPPAYEPDLDWDVNGPEYCEWKADSEAWGRDRERKWAVASLRFLRAALPGAVIYQAALHQDENSPHCHLLFVPSDDSDRISWRQLSAAAVGENPPAGITDEVQRAKIMSAWQDWYHTEVGERFGLERGERGSTRKHEPLTDKKRRKAVEKRRIAQARAEMLARLEAEQEARAEDVRRLEAQKEEIRNAAYLLGVLTERASVRQDVEPPGDPQIAAGWLTAEERLEEVETTQLGDSIGGYSDWVLEEIVESWRQRVGAYREALKSGNLTAIEAFANDEPVPGYSAEEWAEKKKRLQKEQFEANMDDETDQSSRSVQIDAGEQDWELGANVDPGDGAADGPSPGETPE